MTVALNQLFWHQIGSYLLVYLDDIICVSESPEQHLNHLRSIFKKIRGANLKLHPKKCNFFQTEVKYLGFIFNSDGVKSDPEKTAIIRNYPTPKKIKDIRAFLGMTNFFRRYIKNYANLCYPLYRLLKKDVPFLWTDKEEQSFNALKNALSSPPILALPDLTQEMILTTDVSDLSVSYNLSMI